jgi:flagellar operon protein
MVTNINGQLQKLSQIQEAQKKLKQSSIAQPEVGAPSFKDVLQQKVTETGSEIQFSAHAEKRLSSRNIEITPDIMNRLQNAVAKAKEKGANETLMVFDKFSLIVSVKNNTVITAVDNGSLKDNVFTNIDSAVFA